MYRARERYLLDAIDRERLTRIKLARAQRQYRGLGTDALHGLAQALRYYRRLCLVKDPASAQINRVSALSMVREALQEIPRFIVPLQMAQQGEVDSRMLCETPGVNIDDASTALLSLWKEQVETRTNGRERTIERIFLERRSQSLPDGGRMYCYRLSALGQLLMEGMPC